MEGDLRLAALWGMQVNIQSKNTPLSDEPFCLPVLLLADLGSSATSVNASLNSGGVWLLPVFV